MLAGYLNSFVTNFFFILYSWSRMFWLLMPSSTCTAHSTVLLD